MSPFVIRLGLVLLMFASPVFGQYVKPVGKKDVFSGELLAGKGAPLIALKMNLKGTFWRDSDMISKLSLTADQQKKMDDIFQQYRLKLVDLTAALQKDELILAPMVESLPAAGDARIIAQIDRVAQDRAELEKANSRMFLELLQTLTPEQWTRLRERKK